jgi:hypothetical protein
MASVVIEMAVAAMAAGKAITTGEEMMADAAIDKNSPQIELNTSNPRQSKSSDCLFYFFRSALSRRSFSEDGSGDPRKPLAGIQCLS